MTDAFIQIAPDSTGKKVDNSLLTVDGQQVYRQRVEAYITGVDDLGNTVGVPVTPEGHLISVGVLVPPTTEVSFVQVATQYRKKMRQDAEELLLLCCVL